MRCGGVAASPGRAVGVLDCGRALDACDAPTCDAVELAACDRCGAPAACDLGSDEFAAFELAACGAPDRCDAPGCDATSAASLCPCAASDVTAPG